MGLNRLIFIRHGETDWNREGRLQGQRETSLNARGRDQATGAGRLLSAWLGSSEAGVLADIPLYCSPMLRTRETMDLVLGALQQQHDGPPEIYRLDERLREISFGAWEGLTWRDVRDRYASSYRARRADKWHFVPPGGESYAMLADRVGTWLATRERSALVVSHGGVARVLMHLLAGAASDKVCDAEVDQGRLLIFEDGGHFWV